MIEKLKSWISNLVRKEKVLIQKDESDLKALPIGLADFHSLADRIIGLSGAPANDSSKWTLAAIILELKSDVDKIEDSYLVRRMRKAMSNEVASAYMYELKQKQFAEKKAEEAAAAQQKATEATVSKLSVVSSVPSQNPVS